MRFAEANRAFREAKEKDALGTTYNKLVTRVEIDFKESALWPSKCFRKPTGAGVVGEVKTCLLGLLGYFLCWLVGFKKESITTGFVFRGFK